MSSVASEFRVIAKLEDCAEALAVSATEDLAVGSLSGQLMIATKDQAPTFMRSSNAGILDLAWSHEGSLLLAADESGGVELFDLHGEKRTSWKLSASAEHVAWIGIDEALIAAGRSLNFVGKERPVEQTTIAAHIAAVAIRGRTVFLGGHGGVWAYSLDTRKELFHLPHNAPILSIAVSKDAKLIAAGDYARGVHLWNLETGQERHSAGYDLKIEQIAFIGSSPTLVIANWGQLTIWKLGNDAPFSELSPRRIHGHTHRITQLRESPTGTFASGAADGSVCVWNLEAAEPIIVGAMADSEVRAIEWSPTGDGLYVATVEGATSYLKVPVA